jgi:2-hydroxychromene-2-carboxylate isomerase
MFRRVRGEARMLVEFLYDFASPHSYVAFHKLREVSSRLALEVNYSPIFLGGIFKATNDAPLPADSLEYDYMAKSLQRISKALGIPFNFQHSSFPVNSLRPLRGTYFASSEGKLVEYISAVFGSYWASGVDISDQSALGKIAGSLGLDRDRFLHSIEDEAVKLRLKEDTQRALERGVFGAPTYFVNGEMYWGSPEVLWYLEELLAGVSSRDESCRPKA